MIRLLVIVLIEPASDNRLTGGYIYNEEICRYSRIIDRRLTLDESAALGYLYRLVNNPTETRTELGLPRGIVVDSLFLESDKILDRLRSLSDLFCLGLIHYLPVDEPDISEEIRDRRIDQMRKVCSVVDGLIVTSSYAERAFKRIIPTYPRISVVSPGVGASIRKKKRQRAWPPRKLLTVGAVTPNKGHRHALEALRSLRRFGWQWTIVGTPADSSALTSRIERLSLGDRIDFAGAVAQSGIADWYAGSDLFLFPTLHESYGMVCAEAAANGLPVVGYRTGGVSHIIRHGENGWLAPTGSIRGLRKHLDRAFRSNAWFDTISRGSSNAAKGFATWESAAAEFDGVLRSYEKPA